MDTIIVPKLFTKSPAETLDYTCDLTRELQAINDTIASVFWIVPSRDTDDPAAEWLAFADGVKVDYGLTPGDDGSPKYIHAGIANTSYLSVAHFAGGTLGAEYRVQCNMVTNGLRYYARQAIIKIAYR